MKKGFSKKLLLSIIGVFVLTFSIRLYYISQKVGVHFDELLTVSVSRNIQELIFPQSVVISNTGKSFKNAIFGESKPDLKSNLSVLRENNFYNKDCPSLYFTTFRILSNSVDVFDINSLKLWGCGFNLLLFCFEFLVMTLLLRRLFGDNKLVPIGLAVIFLSTGMISMTLFVRPYELQIFSVILLTYLVVVFLQDEKVGFSKYLLLIFSLFLCMSSGYFMLLYIGVIGLLSTVLFYIEKRIGRIFLFLIGFFVALGLSTLFYDGYFSFLESNRFTHMGTFFSDNFIFSIGKIIFSFLFYVPVFILLTGVGIFVRKDVKLNDLPVLLFFTGIIVAFLIEVLAPFKILRYVSPFFPVILLIIPYLLSKLKGRIQNIIAIIFVSIYLILSLIPIKDEIQDYQVNLNNFANPVRASIENLYPNADFLKNFDDENPVIIYEHTWFNHYYVIPFMKNNREYLISYGNGEPVLTKYNHYYVITDYVYKIPKDYEEIKSGKSYNLTWYEVKKEVIDKSN